jgi:hypothetical protein
VEVAVVPSVVAVFGFGEGGGGFFWTQPTPGTQGKLTCPGTV